MLCGCVEQFGDGSPALKLGTNRPLVFVRDPLPHHDQDEIWEWIEEGFARWGKVCDLVANRIRDLAQARDNDIIHLVTVDDLGGGGVLADQMLPYTGGRVLKMRINSRISWRRTDGPMTGNTIDPVRTLTHEIGHFLGMSHFPVGAPAELMEPSISQSIIGPQPTEAKVAAGWFGPPKNPVPPPTKYTITLTSDTPIKVA